MKYLLMAYGDRKKMETLSKTEFEALVAQCRVHDEEFRKTGRQHPHQRDDNSG